MLRYLALRLLATVPMLLGTSLVIFTLLRLIPGDADGYWYLAGQIAAGKDYEIYDPPRRVMRMPGFPFLLALPRMMFGENLLAVRLWLAVIGTSACGFVYLLGRELCDAKSAYGPPP